MPPPSSLPSPPPLYSHTHQTNPIPTTPTLHADYDYTLSDNGVAEHHRADYATDYLPNVILAKTLAFLDANLGTSPVLAVLSTPSCHGPQEAAPQYQNRFPGVTAPRSPSYNATVPGTHWIQSVKAVYPFDDNAAVFSDLVFRRRLQTLLTVDDILQSVVDKLTAAGELDNTYIAYTADNVRRGGRGGKGGQLLQPSPAQPLHPTPLYPPALPF